MMVFTQGWNVVAQKACFSISQPRETVDALISSAIMIWRHAGLSIIGITSCRLSLAVPIHRASHRPIKRSMFLQSRTKLSRASLGMLNSTVQRRRLSKRQRFRNSVESVSAGMGLRPGSTGTDPGGRIFQPTLQATQVRHLAQMLTPFNDEMAEHSADGKARTLRGIRTPREVRRGQRIEIPQRGTPDGLVVCQ